MSFRVYLKKIKNWLVCFGTLFTILNLILISSTSIKYASEDIIYLDIFLCILYFIFVWLNFLKWKNNFHEIYKALEDKANVDLAYLNKDNFESEIIRKVINQKNSEMEIKTKDLKTSLDDINEYILKWVHEIKIPISVLGIISERLEDDKTSKSLKIESDRIRFLVDQALYIGRAADYSYDIQIGEVSILDSVKEIIKRNASFFIYKKIELELECEKLYVMSDKKWLLYILDQIINNACKYVGNNGEIKIWTKEDDKKVELHIKDNGIGIANKDIERVFDKGFTGDNGRKSSVSTGMGLYVSKKMAEKLNHKIYVYSKQGEFTEFVIVFYKMSDYFNVT